MPLDSGLHETRTNAEHSETADDLRVSFESDSGPARSDDGRLMYYEPQLQRVDDYQGFLDEKRIPDDELRALYSELTIYFGVCDYWHFQLPPAGLPGLLHEKYERDEEAAKLLRFGIEYVGAIIANERKTMHNRWQSARELIEKIERRTEDRIREEYAKAEVGRALAYDAQREAMRQKVYFIGSETGPIKIGMAANPHDRLKGLQTSHYERLELLAVCPGGQAQERAYHKQYAGHRLHGEWFERSPEIEAEIARLNAPKQHHQEGL